MLATRHGLLTLTLLALGAPHAAAQERRSTRIDEAELAAISARGRRLAAYDAAAWHGSDAVRALGPGAGAVRRYIAYETPEGWRVAFGRLTAAQDTFLVAYEATAQAPDRPFTAQALVPERAETGALASAARAIEAALVDFQPVGRRPYNVAVLPAPDDEWWVYAMPAATRADVFPLGGDVRVRVSADGRTVRERRALHRTVIEYGPYNADSLPVSGYHTAIVDDRPEDTDVFLVLRRLPRMPEYIVSRSFFFRIDLDGTIIPFDRPRAASTR